jgi:hypothetical protein
MKCPRCPESVLEERARARTSKLERRERGYDDDDDRYR